jgi:hypothetical protein
MVGKNVAKEGKDREIVKAGEDRFCQEKEIWRKGGKEIVQGGRDMLWKEEKRLWKEGESWWDPGREI